MVSRRFCLFLPTLATACFRRAVDAFRGYAFIANQEGQAVAALDLEVMAVARHISLDDAPAQMLAANMKPLDRKSTRLNSSHSGESRMPSSA